MDIGALESALPSEDEKRQENILLFRETKIRHDFLRKVFSLVLSQIILTCIIVAPMILYQPARELIVRDRALYYGSYIFFLAIYAAILCCTGITRSYPLNYIILLIMTVALSVWVGCICSRFPPRLVLISIGITFFLCLSLYLFAKQTAIDFTAYTGILFICSLGTIPLIILLMFFPSDALLWIVLVSVLVLLCIYFVVDLQMMMGGQHKYSLGPEDYILAATLLYIDIIMIFIYILMIVAQSEE